MINRTKILLLTTALAIAMPMSAGAQQPARRRSSGEGQRRHGPRPHRTWRRHSVWLRHSVLRHRSAWLHLRAWRHHSTWQHRPVWPHRVPRLWHDQQHHMSHRKMPQSHEIDRLWSIAACIRTSTACSKAKSVTSETCVNRARSRRHKRERISRRSPNGPK